MKFSIYLNRRVFVMVTRVHCVTLLFFRLLEDTEAEESVIVLSLLDSLGQRGVCLGHLLDFFQENNYIRDIIEDEHAGSCPYCDKFFRR